MYQIIQLERVNTLHFACSISGINFYTESGFVFVTKDENEFSIAMERSQKSGLAAEDITMSWKTVFPYLEIPENAFVFWERNKYVLFYFKEIKNNQIVIIVLYTLN